MVLSFAARPALQTEPALCALSRRCASGLGKSCPSRRFRRRGRRREHQRTSLEDGAHRRAGASYWHADHQALPAGHHARRSVSDRNRQPDGEGSLYCFPQWSKLCQLLTATFSLQVTMAKAWTRSLFSLPVTCLTAAVQTITTSWKTSSCECATADIFLWTLFYLNVSFLQLCGEQPGDACGRRLPDHLHEWGHSSK